MSPAKTYPEKLRDPRWQRLRLEIFNRDEWKCRKCDDGRTELQVHHRYYQTGGVQPWEYPHDALLTLCAPCHKEETFMDPSRDPVYEAWVAYDPARVPLPSVIAACRALTTDAALIRLVNRLAWDGHIAAYAEGQMFLDLVGYRFAAPEVWEGTHQ
jgi:hypothetical protein